MTLAERFNSKDRHGLLLAGSGVSTFTLISVGFRMIESLPANLHTPAACIVALGIGGLVSFASIRLNRWNKAEHKRLTIQDEFISRSDKTIVPTP